MNEKGNRVIICADVSFPEGDPGAHRIQYVAKALQHAGKEVLIISHGRFCENNSVQYYDGVPYFNYSSNSGGKLQRNKIFGGLEFVKTLKRFQVSAEDIVYIYGSNALMIEPVYLFCKRNRIAMCIDVVEWHQPYQYKYGTKNPRYLSLNYTFTHIAPRIGNVIAISVLIRDYYLEKDCNVCIIPPMTNIDESADFAVNRKNTKIKLIYPGNPLTKDDVEVMLEALNALNAQQRSCVRMHFTGVSEQKIRNYLAEKAGLLDSVRDIVVFHGFLEYAELEALYRESDFLLLPRYDNKVTHANFPSKVPELMKWGIVPICNQVGDYYTYLEDGKDAILFKDDTAEQCRDAIIRAISLDPKEIAQMRQNAQRCVRERFDYRIWSERLSAFVCKQEA